MPHRAISPDAPRHALLDPPPITFGIDGSEARALLSVATQECAALAAGVEALVGQAVADLAVAVTEAEARIAAAAQRAVDQVTRASSA